MSVFAVLILVSQLLTPVDMPTESTLRDLVRQLGDKSYRVREAAAAELVKGGSKAVPVLQEGLKDKDFVISERCRQLLPLAASYDRNKKLARLLSDPTAPPPEKMPGLERFLMITGDSKEARELYAEMYGLHDEIIEKSETDGKAAGELFGRFCDDAYNRWQANSRAGNYSYDTMLNNNGEMALFFFIAGDSKVTKNPTAMNRAQMILYAPRIPKALAESGEGASPVFKKLFLHWLENESTTYLQSRGFQLAANANLKEALPVAKKLLARKELAGYNHGQIIMAFAKFGDKDSIKELEPFVASKSVVTTVSFGNGMGQKRVETGDVALAVIIHLHGQKPAEFGFDSRLNMANNGSSYIYCGFGTEKEREDARAKWNEWAAKNLKK